MRPAWTEEIDQQGQMCGKLLEFKQNNTSEAIREVELKMSRPILKTAFLTLLLTCSVASTLQAEQCTLSEWIDVDSETPKDDRNNIWYCQGDSDTVFVFVHGFLGDSSSTWSSEEDFWPKIVRSDPAYSESSIFLGGYDTEIMSIETGIIEASRTLFSNLNIKHESSKGTVLDKPKIVFIAHSLGGIVVRNMLTEHPAAFSKKRVGLVLVASPSLGSVYSNRNTAILKLLRNRLGDQLSWDNDLLSKIDRDFRRLLDEESIERIAGVEVLEGKVIVPGLFNDVIVDATSGARYWSDPAMLDREDHFSISKPIDRNASIHREVLADFMQNRFEPLEPPTLSVVVMDSPQEVYLASVDQGGKMNAHHISSFLRSGLPNLNLDVRVVPVFRGFNDFSLIDRAEPDVVIIHYSAWRDGREKDEIVQGNSLELLLQFGEWLRQRYPAAKLIIYTRVGETEWANREQGRNIECLPIVPALEDCGFFVSKRGQRYSNFLNPVVQTEFRNFVEHMIE